MHLYREAARICQVVSDKRGSAKNLVFASSYENKKQLFALVVETIKYDDVLKQILESSRLLKLERSIKDVFLAKCLLFDFLIGKGLRGAGNFEEAILRHSAALKAALVRIKVKAKVANNKDLLTESSGSAVKLPRYVRVNTLRSTVQDIVQQFKQERYQLVSANQHDYERYLELVRALKGKQFLVDIHVQELLVFPPGEDLHEHPLYLSGDIILQDKASCLPAMVLDPPTGSQIIDCCAAPGNKTTHLAAIVKNKGKVFAFDKDAKRLSTLTAQVLRAGALCVVATHADFLLVDPDDARYAGVEYFLVDPSCSGSGIANRLNSYGVESDEATTTHRLKSLSSFQTSILTHAMSFPRARRVVYSTCSVHKEENELVVKAVAEAQAGSWKLTSVLPSFPVRGIIDAFPQGAEHCVRLNPEDSLTNGFFIACFTRVGEAVRNENTERKQPESVMAVLENSNKRKAVEELEESSKEQICSKKVRKSKKKKDRQAKKLESENKSEQVEVMESSRLLEISSSGERDFQGNSTNINQDGNCQNENSRENHSVVEVSHKRQIIDDVTKATNDKSSIVTSIDHRKVSKTNVEGKSNAKKKTHRRKRNQKPITTGVVVHTKPVNNDSQS